MNPTYVIRMILNMAFILSIYLILQMSTIEVLSAADNVRQQHESRNKRVTLEVANMPLGDVSEKLAGTEGITLIFKDTTEEKLSLILNNVSLNEAFRRLLRQKNFAIIYDNRGTPLVVYIIGKDAMFGVSQLDERAKPPSENTSMEALGKFSIECTECIIEDELDAVAETEAFESPELLLNALNSPEADVRTTALRWAMISAEEIGKAALEKALMDNDGLVHSVAMEIIFESGADPKMVEEILMAVEEKDSEIIQAAVYHLFK